MCITGRSLCDAVAHTAGVSSEPDFVEYEFNPSREDLILVMASDGSFVRSFMYEILSKSVGQFSYVQACGSS